MSIFSFLFKRKKTPKIKLGLALGSGGAKGFAELGVLKAFEENDIKFDVVGGTSIGSIIGAFYADGYSSTDIYEMLIRIKPSEIAGALILSMETSGLKSVIDREIGYKNIEDLKKPFVCVATEVEKGVERVFESGNTALALCASSCYPPFFKPVEIDGERFVDGAFTNSIPADRVKELGADFIVAVDISNREDKPSLLSRIFPSYKSEVKEPWAKGYQYADIVLNPDLEGFKPTSFLRAREMYDIGYNYAMQKIEEIKLALSKVSGRRVR